VWAPDGQHLFFISDRSGSMNLWRVAIDESSGKILSAPEPVTIPAQRIAHISTSADGSRLAFASVTVSSHIQRVAFDPIAGAIRGTPLPVTSGTRKWFNAEPSPDGKWLAYVSQPQEDVFVSRTDGSGVRQLTNDAPFDRLPHWAPDSSRIAFHSNRGGSQQIWTIRPDGSDLTQLTDSPGSGVVAGTWSPDGTRMVAAVPAANKLLLFDPRQPWKGQSVHELPPLNDVKWPCWPLAWSPDGRQLACTASSEATNEGLYLYSIDSRSYRKVADHGRSAAWLHDSRRLLYTTIDSQTALLDTRTRDSHDVISLLPDSAVGARLSPDNRELYFVRESDGADIYMLTLKQK
jgi:Tol biopolymer transport system component